MSRPIVVTACMLAPPNRGGLNSTHIHGTSVPVEEPSTASQADSCTATNRSSFDHLVGAATERQTACGRGALTESSACGPSLPPERKYVPDVPDERAPPKRG